ncbi:ABC transporter ATP-binding protein [Corynebacterium anserum]|uniref:ATP-binding cassette domain-containing protein n=1 Tax=Corynebacterium anserum TaxID=2684406 RepID=A0A7G7YLY0_9CORY|nr:ABC transporter ATP-binding protein [Corynebacterium anserum]QNH95500.1 ATP-binding cassette domain-containing protein [Corynebacterium anserum]
MSERFPLATWQQVRGEVSSQIKTVSGAGRRALVAVLALAMGAWLTVQVPQMLGRIVDCVRGDGESLGLLGVLLVLAAIGGAVFNALGFFTLSTLSERVIANVRETMVATALGLPLHRVEEAGTGDLVSRSTDDVAEVSSAVTDTLPILATSVFTIAATAVALVTVDPRMLVIMLVSAPVYWLGARRYLAVAPDRYAEERAAMAERARRFLEAIRGRATVRAFSMEDRMHRSIYDSSFSVVIKGMKARQSMFNLQLWISLGEFINVGGTVLVGFYMVQAGVVSVGAVTGAALMMIRIRGPIMQLMRVMDTVQSAYASLARIVGVTLKPPLPVPDSGAGPVRGEVVLQDVCFSYGEGHAAVQNVSFSIKPGETVALVGASGAGKSTVAAVLMGLRIPESGTVTLDGMPVHKLSDRERARRLAMVSQEVHTFSGSLRDDLTLANEDASDEELIEVLKRVGADWFVHLPRGLDTEVGAMGIRLDPVESQQLALARVLLMDPAVVVMDEATAEAGSVHADVLERAADEVSAGRSVLMVAHRLDQAAKADRVMVMENGRIVESGAHQDLVDRGGIYTHLWEAWIRGR